VGAVLVSTRSKKPAGTTAVATSPSFKPTDWRALKDAPTARQQFGVAVADGSVWVIGGITDAASTTSVERYDAQHDQWSKGPDLPLPLHHQMAVTFGGHVVMMGGWLPQGEALNAVTSDRVFELRGNKWNELPKLPRPRAAGAAAVVGDKIVVFGGQASGKLVPETDVFDGKTWSAGPALLTARDHLGGASDGKYIYALGGRELSPDKNVDAVERFDPAANKWEAIAPLPASRGDVAAALIAGRIFVLGGETSTQVFPTTEALDLRSVTWGPAPAMPTARHGLGVAAVGATLYTFGGALRPGHTASATTTEGLGFAEGGSAGPVQWQRIREAPTPRQQVAAAVDDGTLWVAGGLAPDGATAKVEGYDLTIDTWKSGPDLPVPLHDAMAATFHGELVVLGGWLSDSRRIEARVSDKVYALRANQWVEMPPLLAGRAAGAAAVVGQRLIVFGGTDGRALTPTTEVFDGTRWSFGADLPTPRDHLAAASDGHYAFAVGGRRGSTDTNLAAFERYDPDAHLWLKLPDLDTVEIFELRSTSWSPGPPLGAARHGLAVASVRSALFAIDGGLAPGGGRPGNAAEVLRF
jgi:non-specific serine/threonine protein kinase